ncbi:N-acetylneuraminate synthase [Roseburia sp.]|jgi:N,N'-diacetyllegionaminate synthase|uniref:N-acetylneuraminate synthase n=1 Tax=Roseburia sp. TaxID=2049040 RepID=UPI003522BB71
MKPHVFIIAEAGVNHNGSLELAYKLVDAAKEANADCVKFQTYITENDTAVNCEKAEYQKTEQQESQYELLKKLELSFDDFRKIQEYCKKKGIMFLSTPFDIESLKFLEEIHMPIWKIASSEVENFQLLREMAKTHKPIILSTGMCTIEEISNAVDVLKKYGAGEIRILHCNTQYPTPMEDVNLKAMYELKSMFQCDIGYSDHTQGIEVPIAAVAMGATIIEKHFTLDRNMEGPDHVASLNPLELKEMVQAIRNIEKAIGTGKKVPSNSEKENRIAARKSIFARCEIKKGQKFTEENIIAKRPGGGVNPMRWEEVIGTCAVRNFKRDEMIEL